MLDTDRLRLRPLAMDDAAIIEELAGDYDVAKTTLTIPHPYPEGTAKDFIASVKEMEEKGRIVIFAITEKGSNQLLGIINLSITTAYERGELAYWVGKPYWGMGYGTEAARALMKYGFEEKQLNKIYAQTFINNPGSQRIMEKIGLKYEGTLRQHVARFGDFHDLASYGLLKTEYFATQD